MKRKKVGKLPPAVSEYFRQLGKKATGEKKAKGALALANSMTPEERSERARKAAAASAKVRRRKAAEKK